jgi:hypothetical protein
MTHPQPTQMIRRLLLGLTLTTFFGSDAGFAQGMPGPTMPRPSPMMSRPTRAGGSAMSSLSQMPTMGAPLGSGVSGVPLGTIGVYAGSLGQSQSPALGSITNCLVNGISAAGSTWPAIASIASTSTASPSPASPPISSPLATFPVTTSPVPGPSSMNQAAASASANSTITPLGATGPVASGFGTSTTIGFCSPSVLGATTMATLPESSSPAPGSAFSDAAIPLAATEASGGGLSPLVDVPPPVLFSPGATVPTQ